MRHCKFLLMALASIMLAVVSGCGGGGGSSNSANTANLILTKQEAKTQGAWTILVYLDADNDLESAGISNFNQMEMVGSNKDVRIIVQMDRAAGHDTSNGNWTDARRYLITRDNDASTMNSIRLDDTPLGEQDMGDWRTLKDFVEWGTQEFPADHYCLIIWDHGTGWSIRALTVEPTVKFIAMDDSGTPGMNVTDIPQALAEVNMDVIAFDACLMSQLETAYELRNSALYMVGSPGYEPSPGYDYSSWLRGIGASTSPSDLCRTIVQDFPRAYPPPNRGITQCALDLSKVGAIADAADQVAQSLMYEAAVYPDAQLTQESVLDYSVRSGLPQRFSLDLVEYAQAATASLSPMAINAAATLSAAVSDAIVAESHNPDTPTAHGVGVYVPEPTRYDGRYETLSFAQNTQWDEWIKTQQ